MKELTRFELAACKRVAANTKSLRTKVEKLNTKIEELSAQKSELLNEIVLWEAPITEKYGCSVEDILDGTYLKDSGEEVEPEDYAEPAVEEIIEENNSLQDFINHMN